MANYKTGAQRYNDKMDKIWNEAKKKGALDDRKITKEKDMKMTTEQATKEFCGTLGFNYEFALKYVKEFNIDIHSWLMRLDAEDNVLKKIDIGQEFMIAIRPF